jgi:hypothetical protein
MKIFAAMERLAQVRKPKDEVALRVVARAGLSASSGSDGRAGDHEIRSFVQTAVMVKAERATIETRPPRPVHFRRRSGDLNDLGAFFRPSRGCVALAASRLVFLIDNQYVSVCY